MKIISPFKDYYDYLISVYGVDEKIVYVRSKVNITKAFHKKDLFFIPSNKFGVSWKWIVVNGGAFLFFRYSNIIIGNVSETSLSPNKWILYNRDDLEIQKFFSISKKVNFLYTNVNERQESFRFINYKHNDLTEISKQISRPIFEVLSSRFNRVKRVYEFEIGEMVPKLKEYGFNELLEASVVYQELEYFLCNILNESPDIKPPVVIEDKFQVVAKGFTKESFRTRKK